MNQPIITRPHFPKGYIEDPKSLLPWSHVKDKLTDAIHYWLCTVRPDGRPHTIPKWAVMVDGKLYFDGSPKTRHAKNIANNSNVSIHLESGSNVVIAEGRTVEVSSPPVELGKKIASAYVKKYASLGYSPKPNQWDKGGLFEITLTTALAWTDFTIDPTKFKFNEE